MFKESQEKAKNPLWKFLPLALIIFVAVVGAAIFLSDSSDEDVQVLTGIIRSDNSEFQWYSDYLKLVDPKIQMGLNFAGNRIVMISGLIENNGERTVDVVEVKIAFFNYEEPISEAFSTPVKPGPYSPPIEPLSQRTINFYIEKIPKGWKSSHAEIEISGIRFLGQE